MAREAAKTGIMPMALVAIEQYFPKAQHIVDDDLAFRFLPFGGKGFVRLLQPRRVRDWLIGLSEKHNPGIWGGLLCRKRYIDEKVFTSRNEIEALVNLGAGLDTRACRPPVVSRLPVWELDQNESVRAKEKRLHKVFGSIPANIKLVPVDFDRDDPGAVLAAHGYSLRSRTFFIWEGVSQYLTEQGVRATFGWLAKAAPGSRLVFTYVRRSFLEGKDVYGWESGYKQFVASRLWKFGMESADWPAFLRNYGCRIIEDAGYDELASRYILPAGRRLVSTPVERIVYAEKEKRGEP